MPETSIVIDKIVNNNYNFYFKMSLCLNLPVKMSADPLQNTFQIVFLNFNISHKSIFHLQTGLTLVLLSILFDVISF